LDTSIPTNIGFPTTNCSNAAAHPCAMRALGPRRLCGPLRLSERGDPIATHGFENLGQGRSATPGLTQIVTTPKIQGEGGTPGPPLDHV
jgi:hypothetical protein